MANKFISFLEAIGRDFNKYVLPVAEAAAPFASYVPAFGPLFAQTVNAIVLAEQNFAAAGKQNGTGPQKLAAVIGVSGNLIKQGMVDAGVSNPTQAQVEGYVSSVVTVLNMTPATAIVAPPAIAALPGTIAKL
jgi:hypothetical protein